ncbi:MAG: hypothetical protein J0H73_13285 [Salana multivorans]|uniref:AfsA-related hotdog domain-containing protein n=1 Tax=Salana multivorans TaxID=120377 RepID=UPI00096598F2|nr:AfsA-related hotdog domain-containing protein [Salana multivorans]MBN8883274.1 hypothetical protein [Salana multivorans]OJX98176.1 MAG: hypothetical protein BGO96_09890 [Micrococcales bacterium 73-15]
MADEGSLSAEREARSDGDVTAPTEATGAAPPTDWSPVLKRQVHKNAGEEVLLSSYAPDDELTMTARTRWPGRHDYYRLDRGADVFLLVETFRQMTILIGHELFQVPPESVFVMDRCSLRLASRDAVCGNDVTVRVRAAEVEAKGARVYRLGVEALFFDGAGRELASGDGSLRILPRRLYQRLRAGSAGVTNLSVVRDVPTSGTPLELRLLDRQAGARTWELRFDPLDPFFFDHAVDHVPGMLLISAMRDAAARSLDGATCVGLSVEFVRYLELDEPVHVRVRPDGHQDADGAIRVGVAVVGANHSEAATGTMEMAVAHPGPQARAEDGAEVRPLVRGSR